MLDTGLAGARRNVAVTAALLELHARRPRSATPCGCTATGPRCFSGAARPPGGAFDRDGLRPPRRRDRPPGHRRRRGRDDARAPSPGTSSPPAAPARASRPSPPFSAGRSPAALAGSASQAAFRAARRRHRGRPQDRRHRRRLRGRHDPAPGQPAHRRRHRRRWPSSSASPAFPVATLAELTGAVPARLSETVAAALAGALGLGAVRGAPARSSSAPAGAFLDAEAILA